MMFCEDALCMTMFCEDVFSMTMFCEDALSMTMFCEDVWQVFGKTVEGFVQSPPAIAGHAAPQTFSQKCFTKKRQV